MKIRVIISILIILSLMIIFALPASAETVQQNPDGEIETDIEGNETNNTNGIQEENNVEPVELQQSKTSEAVINKEEKSDTDEKPKTGTVSSEVTDKDVKKPAEMEGNKLKVKFDLRVRVEAWNNKDFDSSKGDGYTYTRMKHQMFVDYKLDDIPLFAELRFIRTGRDPFYSLELQQCYADIGKDTRFRVGRQEMKFGDERVISPNPWGETGVPFDGLRVTTKNKKLTWDILALKYHYYHKVSPDSTYLYGIYGNWRDVNKEKDLKQDIDVYILSKDSTPAGSASLFDRAAVYGLRYSANNKGFYYGIEGMHEFGEVGSSSRDAYAFFLKAGHQWKNMHWKPSLGFSYDYYSGDPNPQDGVIKTYNQLFGSNHTYLGTMDFAGPSNVRDLALHMNLYPAKYYSFNAQYHMFRLAERKDAFYQSPGKAFLSDPTGRWSDEIGNELDLELRYINDSCDLRAGYGIFYPGKMFQDAGKGAGDPMTRFFMSTTVKF